MAKLKINRGTTYSRTVNASIDSVPVDLTGSTIRFTMKDSEYDSDTDDSTAVVSKDVTDGSELGVAVITLNPADTASLTPGKYYYDIKLDLDSDGTTVYKLDEGEIKLDGSPTNRLS